jgi:nitrogen fixation protein NifB
MSCGSQSTFQTHTNDDILNKINNHPCYSKEAHNHYARIHLPVAPACNIQCNYCNRKYDCSNESRPGVTSTKLTPQEAVKKVMFIGGEIKELSVVGIAGPGDALANPKKTFETFSLIRKYAPDQRLCLSTNGLLLVDYIDEIEAAGVDHVTVTINTLDPEVGAKIYPWIYFKKKRFTGVEAAKILLDRQLEGIAKCVERGILIKANSVLIPGINDKDLPNVSKKLREMGVFLHNIMPLLSEPEYGTFFGLNGVKSSTQEELSAVQSACEMDMTLMTHCKQCRADAVGLLGEDRSAEFEKEAFADKTFDELESVYNLSARQEKWAKIESFREILSSANKRVEEEKYELSSTGKTVLIAVTTCTNESVDDHFGSAKDFAIYEAGDKGAKYLTKREFVQYCQGADNCSDKNPIDDIKAKLSDINILLTAKIGECPMESLGEIKGLEIRQDLAFRSITEAAVLAASEYLGQARKYELG